MAALEHHSSEHIRIAERGSATFRAPAPAVLSRVPAEIVHVDFRRPCWASPAMDMDAFREAKRWAAEGWRL